MADLPVMLRIEGRRCVVVGGGSVARRRTASLLQAGGLVTVIAPRLVDELAALPATLLPRPYQTGDLEGAFLVVIATDDPAVNARIADDARRARVLVNRSDDPDAGDLSVPAHAHHGPVTIAVQTGGVSAAAAAAIRRELSAALDSDWPRLLETVAPFRALIQQSVPEGPGRQERLRRLSDPDAMRILKTRGVDALRDHCRALLGPTPPPTSP